MYIMRCYAQDKKFNNATGEYDYTFLDLNCNEANKDNSCNRFERKPRIHGILLEMFITKDSNIKYCKDCKNYGPDIRYLNRR